MDARLFWKRNGSTVLSVVGGIGVVVTAVMAVKATPKALKALEEAEKEKGEELTVTETIRVAGLKYIPTIVSGAGTIACIFGANFLNKRYQASLMSACMLLNNQFKEYKNKVIELYGEEVDQEIEEAIFEDRVPNPDTDLQLFYDEYSGRFFESTMFKVQQAEYFLNRDLVMRDYAYLNEWYEHLEIDTIEKGWKFGWSFGMCMEMYWQPWLDFGHSKKTTEDGTEYTSICIFGSPMEGFEDYC